MDLEKAILERYSVRAFSEKRVPEEKLAEIIRLTGLAPSAVNFQPWHFIVISERENLEKLWPVYHRSWIRGAPTIIVACFNVNESWKRSSDGHDFGEVDAAIAIDHLTLAATSAGLGTCWVCNFDKTACKIVLNLPEYIEPLALVPIGYPASEKPLKKRKNPAEIVSWERFGNTNKG